MGAFVVSAMTDVPFADDAFAARDALRQNPTNKKVWWAFLENPALREFSAKVRDSSDIVEVVGAYVKLTKKGTRFWGCCPFHAEKTPSFNVSPERGFFYCFGCHAGGDVFKFISLIENISYWEAVKLQAQKLNIPLPEKRMSPEEAAREEERKKLYATLNLAKDFFCGCLRAEKSGANGRAYWQKRGLTAALCQEFSLGVAPNAWDKLSRAFLARGIDKNLLIKAGLAGENANRKLIDRFRNRVMIPIADERGRTVGFGGRIMNDGEPKYLNTAETPVFNKRTLLYGLDRAKNHIRRAGKIIVVEGYMDAVSLAAVGIKNTVATLGTAFTGEHLKLLLRYGGNIFFCYDNDEAGQRATVRAMDVLKNFSTDARVIVINDGKDPDEFVRKHGAAAFEALTQKALTLPEHRLRYILAHTDYATLTGKLQAITDALPVLAVITNEALRTEYIQKLARHLMIDESSVRSELHKYMRLPPEPIYAQPAIPQRRVVNKRDNALLNAERIVIATMYRDRTTIDYVDDMLPDGLPSEVGREITEFLRGNTNPNDMQSLSDEANAELSRAITEDDGQTNKNAYADAINKLRHAYLNKQYQKLSREAEEYYAQADEESYRQTMKQIELISQEIRDIS